MRIAPVRITASIRALGVLLLIALLSTTSLPAAAETTPPGRAVTAGAVTAGAVTAGRLLRPPPKAQLRADPRPARTTVGTVDRTHWAPPTAGKGLLGAGLTATGGVTASIRVNYDSGFAPAARAAFQRAVDIWARNVSSAVPIVIDATSRPLPPGVLGAAGPTSLYVHDTDGRQDAEDTIYPIALANARAGRDLAPGAADIDAEFNSRAPELYTGTGSVPADKYDFSTVVLHEIGHGLGLLGLVDYSGGRGDLDPRLGRARPAIYDRFPVFDAADGPERAVLSFPRGSRAFGDALTSGRLYWDGGLARSANAGRRPKLYSPPDYESLSSYSHLDEESFPTGSANALMTPRLKFSEVIRDPGDVMLGMLADMGWSVPLVPGARFTAMEPRRLLDSRTGTGVSAAATGAAGSRIGPAAVLDLRVRGGGTGVPSNATAVVLNVTGVGASAGTEVRVYPRPRMGAAVPLMTSLSLRAGETRSNLVTVAVGSGDAVRLRNGRGTVALVADLAGYYATDAASGFHPVTPRRLLDTRETSVRRLGPGASLDLQVAGGADLPATATAVVLTVTGVDATRPTDLRVYPTAGDTEMPEVSNVNLASRAAVANLVIVKVGEQGRVRLRNASGQIAVVVDLAGYFSDAPGGSTFRPVAAARLLDTRRAVGSSGARRLGAGGSVDVDVHDVAGVPAVATAVAVTLTALDAGGATDVRAYPRAGNAVPVLSNLNLSGGQTVTGDALVAVGRQGHIRLRNADGSVALQADVTGWFGP